MRKRMISAAVVLGMGIVGIALAQQAGQPPKGQERERAKLRAQAVKLRVEIELLEVDHDAAKAELIDIVRNVVPVWLDPSQEGMKKLVQARLTVTGDQEALARFEKMEGQREILEAFQATFKKEIAETKASRDRQWKDYAKQAAGLAEKHLELAEIERRYIEAR